MVAPRLLDKAKRLWAEEKSLGVDLPSAFPGKLAVALAYPHRYATAMSNLGFQTVLRLFNEQPQTTCERVFLPDPEDLEVYRRTGASLLTFEGQHPLRSMDVLAFSISYENDYPHLLEMLELARIPLLRKDRGRSDPLVIAGGAAVFLNPEPLADFVDLFVIGEAEPILPALTEGLVQGKAEGWDRETQLKHLSALEGVYVPQFYEVTYRSDGTIASFEPKGDFPPRIRRVYLKDLDAALTASVILTPHTELSSMALLELSRGCPRRCRFCAGSYTYGPYRIRRAAPLREWAQRVAPPEARIGLVGAALSDYPELVSFGRGLLESRCALSFSSLRVDSLSDEVADLLRDSGQRTVTLAPEAGSERMRRVIGKGFSHEEILRAASALAERGIRNLRLYFMVGLPWERDEDVEAIVELIRKIRHHLRQKTRGEKGAERIMVSVNSFVPKPATPFQWHPMEEVSGLNRKIKALQKALRREPGVSVSADLPKWAYLQNLLSRGDRRVGRILLRAHELGGNWPQTFRSMDLNPDFYVYRERREEEILPWDFIDHGISKASLWREYEKAKEEGEKEPGKE
jgi:radical SAM superfamily enzyme YgiQ (UPF0313 family)